MDWYVTNGHEGGSALRQEIRSYLERHCAEGSDIGGAELVVSELLTNAIEYSDGHVWVSLDWGALHPVLTVHDLGPGFTLDQTSDGDQPGESIVPSGRGLMVASHLTRQLEIAAKGAGGSRVAAVLDLERKPTADYDHIPEGSNRLPEPSEARDGFFGRESFLRALVVELADALEYQHGPAAAEAIVARVGAEVGGSMDEAFRNQRGTTDAFSSEELADFYVELKKAIDGDFYVISVDADRIVLGNNRCPFGDSVRHAPSLCRMTSSVFGGAASRNFGRDVAVHLEERIAVGDPGCRVSVWFDSPPPEIAAFVHRYRAPIDAEPE